MLMLMLQIQLRILINTRNITVVGKLAKLTTAFKRGSNLSHLQR